MQIEVVLFVPPTNNQTGERKFTFNGGVTIDDDTKILSVEDEEGEIIADFRDWVYWRKTAD